PLACHAAPALTVLATLSLHDALPISILAINMHDAPCTGQIDRISLYGLPVKAFRCSDHELRTNFFFKLFQLFGQCLFSRGVEQIDRKSTRLNSSHVKNTYAVFCLNKK